MSNNLHPSESRQKSLLGTNSSQNFLLGRKYLSMNGKIINTKNSKSNPTSKERRKAIKNAFHEVQSAVLP